MKIKQCTKCKERKLLTEFYRDKYAKGGFRPHCKKCSDTCHRKYYQIHKIEIAKNYKEYAKTNQSKQAKRKADKKYRQTIAGRLCHCFSDMKNRCNNIKRPQYKNWGGRGIQVKFKSSGEFINYVINELKADPRGLQIDRINNNGNYEVGNIWFVTAKVNSNNRRNSRKDQK